MFVMGNWGWPQWTVFIFSLVYLALGIGFHGKETTRSATANFISIAIAVIILAFGGFFHSFGWPQIVWIALQILSLGLNIRSNGEEYTQSFWSTVIGRAIYLTLYIFAGFFA